VQGGAKQELGGANAENARNIGIFRLFPAAMLFSRAAEYRQRMRHIRLTASLKHPALSRKNEVKNKVTLCVFDLKMSAKIQGVTFAL